MTPARKAEMFRQASFAVMDHGPRRGSAMWRAQVAYWTAAWNVTGGAS